MIPLEPPTCVSISAAHRENKIYVFTQVLHFTCKQQIAKTIVTKFYNRKVKLIDIKQQKIILWVCSGTCLIGSPWKKSLSFNQYSNKQQNKFIC